MLDLVFAVETSESVKIVDISFIKHFLKSVLLLFTISPDQVHVGIISYGNQIINYVPLNYGISRDYVSSALDFLPILGGEVNEIGLLNFIKNDVFSSSSRSGDSVKKLLILIKRNCFDSNIINSFKYIGVETAEVVIGKAFSDYCRNTVIVPDAFNLPIAYPDVESFIGSVIGKFFYFIFY